MSVDGLALLVGVLWGCTLVAIDRWVDGEQSVRTTFQRIALHVLTVMAVVYVLLRMERSIFVAGTVALLVLAARTPKRAFDGPVGDT